jgi:TolA-binding protein
MGDRWANTFVIWNKHRDWFERARTQHLLPEFVLKTAVQLHVKGHRQEALAKYREVVQGWPATDAGKDAEDGIRSIQREMAA